MEQRWSALQAQATNTWTLMQQLVRIILAAIAAAATTALGLDQAGVVILGTDGSVAAIVTVGVVATATPILEAVRHRTAESQIRYERNVSQALRGLLTNVAQLPGVDWREISASVYLVQRSHWYSTRKELRRIAFEGLMYITPIGPATWPHGQGVPGLCWATGTDVHADAESLRHGHEFRSAEEWNRLPRHERLGLSHAEFSELHPRGAESASPILRGGGILGVLVLHASASHYSAIASRSARGYLAFAAATLQTYSAQVN